MARATKHRDQAHARIYARWRELPAWQELSLAAKVLLIEMLCDFRPGNNGKLEWTVRRAAEVLRVSKTTAGVALNELEHSGWITVTRVGSFSPRAPASQYALSMFANDVTGEPAPRDFETYRADGLRSPLRRCRVSRKPVSVRPGGPNGPTRGTARSVPEDTQPEMPSRLSASYELRNSKLVKGLLLETRRKR